MPGAVHQDKSGGECRQTFMSSLATGGGTGMLRTAASLFKPFSKKLYYIYINQELFLQLPEKLLFVKCKT